MVNVVKRREQKKQKREKRKHSADTAFAGKSQLRNGCESTARARYWQELAVMSRKAQS
jgi:CRISPR/Cas system-associated endonuclease Cas1